MLENERQKGAGEDISCGLWRGGCDVVIAGFVVVVFVFGWYFWLGVASIAAVMLCGGRRCVSWTIS